MVLAETIKVSQADGDSVLMLSEDQRSLEVAILSDSISGVSYGGESSHDPSFEPVDLRSPTV